MILTLLTTPNPNNPSIPTGSTAAPDLSPQVNIVVQNPESGGSLSDPLNVIPDEYEEDYDQG